VIFRLNGAIRSVVVNDKSYKSEVVLNRKASRAEEIGSPLQGSLSKILVKEGDKVNPNDPLFIIEAMKMESTITAPHAGEIAKIYLKEKTMVEQDDLVLEVVPLV
jgi:pyruvate carboxylase